eukprot:6463499-Amphidinium_carterae.1
MMSKSTVGHMTLGAVADLLQDLHVKPEHYPSPTDFLADMLREVEAYWAKYRIPEDQRIEDPDVPLPRRRFLYSHDGPTENIHLTEQQTQLSKRMDVSAVDVGEAGAGLFGTSAVPALEPPAPAVDVTPPSDTPPVSAAQQMRMDKVRAKTLHRMVESLMKKLTTCRKLYLTGKQKEVTQAQVFRLESAETWCREHSSLVLVDEPFLNKLITVHNLHMQHLVADWGVSTPAPVNGSTPVGTSTPASSVAAAPDATAPPAPLDDAAPAATGPPEPSADAAPAATAPPIEPQPSGAEAGTTNTGGAEDEEVHEPAAKVQRLG